MHLWTVPLFFCNDENTILPKNFPVFRHEHPRLSSRFTDTFDQTYDACSYMDRYFSRRFEGYKRLAILTRTRYNIYNIIKHCKISGKIFVRNEYIEITVIGSIGEQVYRWY